MSLRSTRTLAPGVALALMLGCHASPSRVEPARPEAVDAPPGPGATAPGAGAGLAIAPDPAAIAAVVADMRFAVGERATLLVVAGERSAALPVENVSTLGEPRWSAERSQVEVPYESSCGVLGQATFSARTLVAHLQSAAALRAYRAGRLTEASAGFARATVLDPDLDHPYMYLAATLAAAGDADQAAAVLQLLLPRNPVRFYVEAMLDPDLAPLRDLPALAALRSPRPGTATIDEIGAAGWSVAIVGVTATPARGYLAVQHSHRGLTGSTMHSLLQIFDAATGELRAELPLATGEDVACDERACDVLPRARPRVARRIEGANRVLRELGFARPREERAGTNYEKRVTGASNIFTIDFPADRLRLWIGYGKASVIRAGDAPDRGRGPGSERAPVEILVERALPAFDPMDIEMARYLPEAHAVVFSWRPVFKCGADGKPASMVLPLSS